LAETASANPKSEFRNPKSAPPLPGPQGPPTLEELNALLADLGKVPFLAPEKQPAVVRLDDDWLTKGDWLGRYGRYWACCCAICSPRNYIWGAGPEKVEYEARIGRNCDSGDSLRYWVHWLYTLNPNTLEMPPAYHSSRVMKGYTKPEFTRRQAEWDDHGEAYPMSKDGPHLFCTLKVPSGLYYLSLYNFNKDGHEGYNRYRDYAISVRAHAAGRPLYEIEDFSTRPELARGRMRDFWGGAYKRFLVRGPTQITFSVSRNHSFNTILAGVMLDLVDERPVPYFHAVEEWKALADAQDKERRNLQAEWSSGGTHLARFRPARTAAEAAARVFDELERMRLVNLVWWAREGRPFYARLVRWHISVIPGRPAGLEKESLYSRAATSFYALGLFGKWEAGQTLHGETTTRRIEKALCWDGVTFSYQGKGHEIVTALLNSRAAGEAGKDSEPPRGAQP
jgi:hypothetical protein